MPTFFKREPLRLVGPAPEPKAHGYGQKLWGRVSAPVRAGDTTTIARAQSVLTGLDFQDCDRYPPVLPVDQAADVVAWAARTPVR